MTATGLGLRYRKGWALRDCDFRLPAGRICGLVGPNGAGKSTLLGLATGLLTPATGTVTVFGGAATGAEARRRVAFLAQDKPLYPRLSVADTLRVGHELNPGWCQETAERIVRLGGLAPGAKIGSLTGGQRTRVALALALGKRPDLLLLDEPLSDVDPVARQELTGLLMAEAAEHGTTVLISSHVLAELDGVCDFVLLLGDGRVRLAGDVDELREAHRLVVGAHEGTHTPPGLAGHDLVELRRTGRQLTALLRPSGPLDPALDATVPTLEDLLLGYLRAPEAAPYLLPEATPGVRAAHAEVAA
ncbi:ATP-binding cassette domain-containing protein [Kitasatospora sp. MMS16-BH015]|uniref:ATP-binding cassette domain-containing protein n=1 Tax=Kitasatospora sp. MMS16-BH015 TaxID=2018025 RepID=UPI0020C251BD|nr:ABC transporter ATP-binding protein [Kitasatospora sp. MMS16-BH015]